MQWYSTLHSTDFWSTKWELLDQKSQHLFLLHPNIDKNIMKIILRTFHAHFCCLFHKHHKRCFLLGQWESWYPLFLICTRRASAEWIWLSLHMGKVWDNKPGLAITCCASNLSQRVRQEELMDFRLYCNHCCPSCCFPIFLFIIDIADHSILNLANWRQVHTKVFPFWSNATQLMSWIKTYFWYIW